MFKKIVNLPETIEELERDSQERQLKNNEKLSDEQKNKLLVRYETLVRRMEHKNYQISKFIRDSIEKKIERSLTLEKNEQIFKKFSEYDVRDIYDTVISIVNKK